MHAGRPTKGTGHVDHLEGTPEAKRRLKGILETIGGQRTVVAVCGELRLGSSRFHAMRHDSLQAALDSLEHRPAGRPPVAEPEPGETIKQLQAEIRVLRAEKKAAEVREEVAIARAGVRVRKRRGRPPKPER